MYNRDKSVQIKGSASCLYNNLSILSMPDKNVTCYATVHKTVVNIANCSGDAMNIQHRQVSCKEMGTPSGNSMILQAKFCEFPSRSMLVILSQRGIQIFEPDGSVMLFWHAFGSADCGLAGEIFARGVTSCGDSHMAVGTAKGTLLIFNIPPKGPNITMSETLTGHSYAVTDLQNQDNIMASADDSGCIIVWKAGNPFSRLSKIAGSGSSCTSVCLFSGFVAAAYGSGHIRIFDSSRGSLLVEICLVSASEDSFVRVWEVKKDSESYPKVEMKFSDCITDVQLCGAKFTNKNGRSFGLTGYDHNEVVCYSQKA
ncbi:WD repeat domain 54-like [Saccoglossus kowalevskii]|uniref:WD repeat-containing protein 54-like n=1 Tax=Saccoglossus kowalevskii TaxID=10224 RepID=A0ABM0M8U1_SACKO|nr:PREDICTED: WD repeat-containing protein 54-like [Saccoglossus kowalevskii]